MNVVPILPPCHLELNTKTKKNAKKAKDLKSIVKANLGKVFLSENKFLRNHVCQIRPDLTFLLGNTT